MITVLLHLLRLLPFLIGGHRQLALENLPLRQQLAVCRRTGPRPKLRTTDHLLWVGLAKLWTFGHPIGPPGDAGLQRRVVRAALQLLERAVPPGPVVEHFPKPWALDFETWKRAWHPKEPSPIIRWMIEQHLLRRA